ncbi:hypothetical protein D3C75_848280 [compost metagenome]
MQVIPSMGLGQLVCAFTFDPAQQTFDTGVLLHIICTIFTATLSASVIRDLQAMLTLKNRSHIAHSLIGTIWLMDGVALGVNLVDCDVNMQVVSVMVNRANALVFPKADGGAYAIFHVTQNFCGWLFTRRK